MTYRKLIDSTTADAADMNDNFYHIGKGSILPMAGDYLRYTDSSCDLGSSTYKWNNVFVNNLDAVNILTSTAITSDKLWTLLAEYSVDSTHTGTTRIEFASLGSSPQEYYIQAVFLNYSLGSIVMNLSAATTGGYRGGGYFTTSNTSTGYVASFQTVYSSYGIYIVGQAQYTSTVNQSFFSNIRISKPVDSKTLVDISSTYVILNGAGLELYSYCFLNTVTAISNIVFLNNVGASYTSNFRTGTTIKIFRSA